MVYDQQLFQQLQEDKTSRRWLTQPHQLETEMTSQQVIGQYQSLQLTHEQEAADNSMEMEEENRGLHQQVSPILSHVTCSTHTHESTIMYYYTVHSMHNSSVCCKFDDSDNFVSYRRR